MSLVRWGKEKLCNGTQDGTQDGTQVALKSGTQDDTEGDTQMIPKDKTMTSYIVKYLPKTKLVSLLITLANSTWCICAHIFMNPVIKVTVIKVIKDFGVFRLPHNCLSPKQK